MKTVIALVCGAVLGGTLLADDSDVSQLRHARFGMFIHWGLYAQPGGRWKGEKMPGAEAASAGDRFGEWLQSYYMIPTAEYAPIAKSFNPTKFDAADWARRMKDAGLGYVVFTTKHHEGFSMFGTKVSDYNIVDATPFGRDVFRELASACRREGIKVGAYYSQNLDWHEFDAGDPDHDQFGLEKGVRHWGNCWEFTDFAKKDFDRYFRGKVFPQVEELLTKYGDIFLMWFDTPTGMKPEQSRALREHVRRLSPHTLVNSRIGNGCGDYKSMGDNELVTNRSEVVTESAMTLNDTWGFRYDDHHWKTPYAVATILAQNLSHDANVLLNVGPRPDGTFPDATRDILSDLGAWLRRTGFAIQGVRGSPFKEDFPWGWCMLAPGNVLQLVLRQEWREDVVLKGVAGRVETCTCGFEQKGDVVVIRPSQAPDPMPRVVRLKLAAPEVNLGGMPKPPPPEAWTFRAELARPQANPRSVIPEGRKPWLENRISRCFFGPIKRAPYFHDELMDDVDYYPDAYLDRLSREGVNGLWLTIEFGDIVETSFHPRAKDGERRLAKLRRTVEKCLRHDIKTWVFAIEPHDVDTNSWIYLEHRDWLRPRPWDSSKFVLCPSVAGARQYLYEAMKDLFTQVPRLGGYLGITNGERPTTCLSWCCVHVDEPYDPHCPRCGARAPHEVSNDFLGAMAKGMLEANPDARLISWFYHPLQAVARDEWIADCAAYAPEGVIFQYNFESGVTREQCRRWRVGGDYWLSCTEPANGFRTVAAAARKGGVPLSAKIQVCNSHECATVPYVPVPGLLYRKYREMRKLGVTNVMQCWYFGNYPGVMNEAAGALAYEDFADGEEAFLMRLAKPDWGADAKVVADLWTQYSDAYSHYPLDNEVQYYGPFHAGVVWPLLPDIMMQNLGQTWVPEQPPSGDVIGEALVGFTVDEALELANEMHEGLKSETDGVDTLDWLAKRHAGDPERMRDIGVMRTLGNLFESARDIFEFYRLRSEAIWRSRYVHDNATAAKCLRRMTAIARNERRVSERQIPLCEADSRLGFHSEAEAHQFHPEYLRWRIARLDEAVARMETIRAELEAGRPYPESAFERQAERVRVNGGWTAGKGEDTAMRWRIDQKENDDLEIRGENCAREVVRVYYWDLCTSHFPRYAEATVRDGKFVAKIPATDWGNDDRLKPRWLMIRSGRTAQSLWPGISVHQYRLRVETVQASLFGRLVYEAENR